MNYGRCFSTPVWGALLAVLSCGPPAPSIDLGPAINAYLVTENDDSAKALEEQIVASRLSADSVYRYLSRGIRYTPSLSGHVRLMLKNADGRERGVGYFVPQKYDPARAYPLLVWLHGGVNGVHPQKGMSAYTAVMRDTLNEQDYFVVSITGERGATWFEPAGRDNIRQGIEYLKRRYHIDPDRIFLAGVSDGGGGCYLTGNCFPTAYAGFAVWSGFPGILGMLHVPLYAGNLRARAWQIVHTGKDHLYPAAVVAQYLDYFRQNGVTMWDTMYPQFDHDMGGFLPTERPRLYAWMDALKRPDPDTVEWQCDAPSFGRHEWLAVTKIGSTRSAHTFPDGPQLPGQMVVTNPRHSRVRAVRAGNEVRVYTRNVAEFAVLIDPAHMDCRQPVRIWANDALVYNHAVKSDVRWMLTQARAALDVKRVYWTALAIDMTGR
jgi:acetyl esterase/lipase